VRLCESRRRYLGAAEKADIVLYIGDKLGQRVADKVAEVANSEYSSAPTLYHAINSITHAACAFRPAMQSEIERYAGTLLAA